MIAAGQKSGRELRQVLYVIVADEPPVNGATVHGCAAKESELDPVIALLVTSGVWENGALTADAAPANSAAIGTAARPISLLTPVACAVRRVCSRGVCRSVRSCAPICAMRRVYSGSVCRSVRSCG